MVIEYASIYLLNIAHAYENGYSNSGIFIQWIFTFNEGKEMNKYMDKFQKHYI